METRMRRIGSARELGATIRGRRSDLHVSQRHVAEAASVSRQWLSEVEAGKPTAEIGRVFRVLDVLELDLIPQQRELPHRTASSSKAIMSVDLDEVLEEYRQR